MTGGTCVPPVAACAVVRPIHFWGPPSHYRMTCVVVSYFGVWGRAPTHADVAFVGSCHTCPHTARRLAGHRSGPGPAVMGSIRVVRHTQRPGGARHLVGHRHRLRRLGRIIRCSQGEAARGFRRACRNTAMAPCTGKARRSRWPILVMAPVRCRPPVLCSRGVIPIQAANSRTFLKCDMSAA